VRILALAATGLALAVAPVAAATTHPVVPRFIQALIAKRSPVLASTPTRMATGYRYERFHATRQAVRIWFRNRAGREILFVAARASGSCRTGMEKSFQMAGNKVWWAHTSTRQEAWRCVTRNHRLVKLVAATPTPPRQFADVGLGRIVASGRRIDA
jgi:hypothetical protein